jgi:guanylate kinase
MIITLTGASGSGKTAIAKAIMEKVAHAKPLTSTTTRKPRPSDLPDDFEYLGRESFERLRDQGVFLWTADVGSTSHGTRTEWLEKAMEDERTISIMILVPEVLPKLYAFADKMHKRGAIASFFIITPPDEVLRRRMRERGDAENEISERLESCRPFERKARASRIPYVWIDNSGELERAVNAVIEQVNK